MKYLFGFNAVPIGRAVALLLVLAAPQAQAGCSMEQTASNEIIIRTSTTGSCNGAALRESLSSALVASSPSLSHAATPPTALSEVKRSSSQGALWRLANMNNQSVTNFTMPGLR